MVLFLFGLGCIDTRQTTQRQQVSPALLAFIIILADFQRVISDARPLKRFGGFVWVRLERDVCNCWLLVWILLNHRDLIGQSNVEMSHIDKTWWRARPALSIARQDKLQTIEIQLNIPCFVECCCCGIFCMATALLLVIYNVLYKIWLLLYIL